MKVALTLRPIARWRTADALLAHPADPARLLALCARHHIDPSGRVFRLGEGLLLVLDRPLAEPLAGPIRLRSVSRNLFVPIDAELVPALLDDEAAGLVRDRGLVFLAGGPVLSFDPKAPLAVSELIACDARRNPWQSLPEPTALPEKIVDIRLEMPGEIGPAEPPDSSPGEPDTSHGTTFSPAAADAVLEPGGEGIGTEAPRPDPSGVAPSVAGAAAMGFGRALMALGRWLGAAGLSRLGARWIQQAMSMAPRLSEAVLGRQAAALRDLLNRFRSGDPEDALRHALPLGDTASSRGATFDESAHLPDNDPRYSLDALVKEPAGPGRGAWLGARDLIADLVREYHKAAEKALRAGDYRRAAYIYGRLLRDYRCAANALLQGGLYRDAAVILLVKLDDRLAAARAFEAAGEIDRAVNLYRNAGAHEAAGDLLAKIGQPDDALVEYRLAADRLDPLSAGDLLLKKTGRVAEARVHFQAGWDQRPGTNDIGCALELAQLDLEARVLDSLHSLLDQADAYLSPPGRDLEAGRFYDGFAQLVEASDWSEVREELLDRALVGLAGKMRQQAEGGSRPSDILRRFLGRNPPWAAEIVRDAEVAVKAEVAVRAIAAPEPPAQRSSLRCPGTGRVTAVCAARDGRVLFLGFEGGELFVYYTRTSRIVEIAQTRGPILSLASSTHIESVVALDNIGLDGARLTWFSSRADGSYQLELETAIETTARPWLTNATEGSEHVAVWTGEVFRIFSIHGLVPVASVRLPLLEAPSGALLLGADQHNPIDRILTPHANRWAMVSYEGVRLASFELPWTPDPREETSDHRGRCQPLVSAIRSPGLLELAAVKHHGTIFWGALNLGNDDDRTVRAGTSGSRGGYQAVALPPSRSVVGVSATHVDVFTPCESRLERLSFKQHACGNVAACLPGPRARELIVIGAEGTLEHVFV